MMVHALFLRSRLPTPTIYRERATGGDYSWISKELDRLPYAADLPMPQRKVAEWGQISASFRAIEIAKAALKPKPSAGVRFPDPKNLSAAPLAARR